MKPHLKTIWQCILLAMDRNEKIKEWSVGNIEAISCRHIDREVIRNKVLDVFVYLPFELNIL